MAEWAVIYVRPGPGQERRRAEALALCVEEGLGVSHVTTDPAEARRLVQEGEGRKLVADPAAIGDVYPVVTTRRTPRQRRGALALVPVASLWEWARHNPAWAAAGTATAATAAALTTAVLLDATPAPERSLELAPTPPGVVEPPPGPRPAPTPTGPAPEPPPAGSTAVVTDPAVSPSRLPDTAPSLSVPQPDLLPLPGDPLLTVPPVPSPPGSLPPVEPPVSEPPVPVSPLPGSGDGRCVVSLDLPGVDVRVCLSDR